MHPAIVAQAAATTQCLFDGRFWLGVGTGEALNEHIVARKCPEARVRLEMLEEVVAILRRLWNDESVSHYGTYFEVENARIYSRPDTAPPIYVSAFGFLRFYEREVLPHFEARRRVPAGGAVA